MADFGLAKLINPRDTHVTTIIAGTLGYLAPGEFDFLSSTVCTHPRVNLVCASLHFKPLLMATIGFCVVPGEEICDV